MFGICLHVAFVGSYTVVMLLGSQDIYISDASITIWPAQPPPAAQSSQSNQTLP